MRIDDPVSNLSRETSLFDLTTRLIQEINSLYQPSRRIQSFEIVKENPLLLKFILAIGVPVYPPSLNGEDASEMIKDYFSRFGNYEIICNYPGEPDKSGEITVRRDLHDPHQKTFRVENRPDENEVLIVEKSHRDLHNIYLTDEKGGIGISAFDYLPPAIHIYLTYFLESTKLKVTNPKYQTDETLDTNARKLFENPI